MTFSAKPSSPWAGNPAQNGQEIITICDVIGTGGFSTPGNTDNSVTLTLGVAYTGETYTESALLFSPPGLTSMPVGPGTFDSNGNFTADNTSPAGTQAVSYVRNDQWIVLGTRDTRTQLQAGSLGKGETCLYGLLGQARVLLKADSSVNLITTDTGDASGNNVQLSITPTGLYFNAPWGKIAFDAAGFRVSTASGGSISLLGSSNPTASTQFYVSASNSTLSSGLITLGNPINAAVPFPVCYGVLPAAAPGIPILGAGVGLVTVAAAASTTVFVGI